MHARGQNRETQRRLSEGAARCAAELSSVTAVLCGEARLSRPQTTRFSAVLKPDRGGRHRDGLAQPVHATTEEADLGPDGPLTAGGAVDAYFIKMR